MRENPGADRERPGGGELPRMESQMREAARREGSAKADYQPPLTLAHVSRRETVRLNTGLPGRDSVSRTK